MRKCNKCGATVNDGWKFCGKCGSNDIAENIESVNSSIESQNIKTQTADNEIVIDIPKPSAIKPKSKNKVLLFALIPAAIFLCLVIAVIVITVSNNNDSDSDGIEYTTDTSASSEETDYESKSESETKQSKQSSQSSAQQDIAYNENEIYTAINIWSQYRSYGVPTFFDTGEIVYGEAYQFLTPSQASTAKELKAAKDFMSYQSEKDKLNKYVDSSLTSDFSEDRYLYYRGIVYCVIPKTSEYYFLVVGYGNETIKRVSYDTIIVTCPRMKISGDFVGETDVKMVYKNGNYKIVNVVDK